MPSHDEYTHHILTAIESGRPVTQRGLARDLGVAVGLVNLLVQRLVKKGYVKVRTFPRNRVRYLITPSGLKEKGRVSRLYLENTVRLYTVTRERIRQRLLQLSLEWSEEQQTGTGDKRIVFYGAGEVAEIAYVSLRSTDLHLVGVVDDFAEKDFFGLPVHRPIELCPTHLGGVPFSRVVIMSLRQSDAIKERLDALGFPQGRVVTL